MRGLWPTGMRSAPTNAIVVAGLYLGTQVARIKAGHESYREIHISLFIATPAVDGRGRTLIMTAQRTAKRNVWPITLAGGAGERVKPLVLRSRTDSSCFERFVTSQQA
jgi:hypothetical protein